MISRYYGVIDNSIVDVTRAYDYSALVSLDEFRELTADADVVFALDTNPGNASVVGFGRRVLEEIVLSKEPRELAVVAFAFDFNTELAEHFCAAVTVVKGTVEWPDSTP